MSIRVTKGQHGKRYAARIHVGNGKYKLLGTRDTRKEAKEDEARWYLEQQRPQRILARNFAQRFLREYGEKHKESSYEHAKGGVGEWLKTFGDRSLTSITREESLDWAATHRWAVFVPNTMLNQAVREGLIPHNPLKGLAKRGRGRADKTPLKVADLERLADCAEQAHGTAMRSYVIFAAYSGLRAGEMFALRWEDIDFKRSRVHVRRRLYKGKLDLPKSNKAREVVLLPEARDALLGFDRETAWVFLTPTRKTQMTQTVLTYRWQKIVAAFGKEVTPHELRHFCGHHLYVTEGMDARLVAAQLGHANARLVEDLYGHGAHGALDELEEAYGQKIRHLRVVND